jgi:hypothetical protein
VCYSRKCHFDVAGNGPVTMYITRHAPNSDSKFHHALMLNGVCRSINVLLATFISGCVVRGTNWFIQYLFCRKGPF